MQKILVPIAYFEACRRALELAGRLAKVAQADITVLHVHRSRLRASPLGIGAMQEKLAEWGLETGPFKLLRQAQEILTEMGVVMLDEQINPVQKHSLTQLSKGLYEVHLLGSHEEDIRFRLREGEPLRGILEEAEGSNCDLIIMGTRGYKGLRRFWVGSIAESVALQAPCSILVAKNLQPYQGVLVGTDGSPPAREAVRQAGELAKLLGTRLTVIAVAEEENGEKAKTDLEEALELLASLGLEGKPLLGEGDPLEELAAEAGQDHITVIGRSEQSKVERFFRSSLPLRLLNRAEAPVLIAASPPSP